MKSVMNHSFAQAPTADIPRASFNRSSGKKLTMDAGKLIPVYLDEVLPGDTFNMNPTIFARINTPLYPLMDNLSMDLQWFFIPMRLLWDNARKFFGERYDPADSIDFTIPTMAATASTGYSNESLFDYLGLPTKIPDYTHSALPIRAYQLIYQEWYRDQNLIDSPTISTADGPDTTTDTSIQRRGKRHDYFTSCLTAPQKGDAVSIPLGTTAPVIGDGSVTDVYNATDSTERTIKYDTGGNIDTAGVPSATDNMYFSATNVGLVTDLSTATAATINQLREAFQIQKLLERDARSGTRYAEIVNSHFGVHFLDVTYRPEFLGGTSVPINIHSVPQTSGQATPVAGDHQGRLASFGTAATDGGGFTKSFTEHGYIMGIASVRADLTYQQGLNKLWSRSTRYDFYWPALAHIGEQVVYNKEIYCVDPATDTGSTGTPDNERAFGYQERFAEYRYKPSEIVGKFRSNDTGSLDPWHLSQEFSSAPALNQTFIEENPPMDRVVAITTEPDFIVDCHFNLQCARPMPLFAVPGLIDHF